MALADLSLNNAASSGSGGGWPQHLSGIRDRVKSKMDNAERSLLEDIEVADTVVQFPSARPSHAPHGLPYHSPIHSGGGTAAAVGAITCPLCQMDIEDHAFCALTGKLHTAPATQFEAVRRSLILNEAVAPHDRQPSAAASAAPPSASDSASWESPYPGGHPIHGSHRRGPIRLGRYCVVRPQREVQRLCDVGGAVAFQEGMSRYCGAQKIGRVTFAKKHCSAADVTFPDGVSWLFPVEALVPYDVPESLDMLERCPVADAGSLDDDLLDSDAPLRSRRSSREARGDAFLRGLELKLQERDLMNRISELQMRYIEGYIRIYKEERRSRKRIAGALRDLREMQALEPAYASRRGHRGRGAFPPYQVAAGGMGYPITAPVEPAGPLPVEAPPVQGVSLPRVHDANTPHDNWHVVGYSQGGYYVFDDSGFLGEAPLESGGAGALLGGGEPLHSVARHHSQSRGGTPPRGFGGGGVVQRESML